MKKKLMFKAKQVTIFKYFGHIFAFDAPPCLLQEKDQNIPGCKILYVPYPLCHLCIFFGMIWLCYWAIDY